MPVTSLAIPTRPQTDTIVAIFLLKTFGKERFPGVESAGVEVRPTLLPGENFDSLLARGVLALDMAEGPLDHHYKTFCTSELTAQYLKVEKDPSLTQLLTWSRRDDKEGKGTISRDALDRAFGLAGLISALNKSYPQEPQKIVDAVLPLLEAHWRSAKEHHVELPRDVEEQRTKGTYREFMVKQGTKDLKVASVISNKPSMPTFLRSERGGKVDVVVQKLEASNHYSILTNQKRGVDLSKAAGLIRMREAQLANVLVPEDDRYMTQIGRIEEVPHWYYDPATNSLLNGGIHSKDVAESLIAHEEMLTLVKTGLEMGGGR